MTHTQLDALKEFRDWFKAQPDSQYRQDVFLGFSCDTPACVCGHMAAWALLKGFVSTARGFGSDAAALIFGLQ